jgi:hypothetical protein
MVGLLGLLSLSHAWLTWLLQPEEFKGYSTADAPRGDGWTATFPPWIDCPILPAGEVGARINPLELVIGVEVGDEARAYPINMLNERAERKVLNDLLGGESIAVTF